MTEHRHVHGVEPICQVLQVAPSTYYRYAQQEADANLRPKRWWKDQTLRPQIQRVWQENRQVYGVRKVWRQLKREGYQVARCTVERLMSELGLHGVVRGKVVKTTISDKRPCPLDKVNRQFHAPSPNRLWVSDFTYVSTWAGVVYVAFVIDVYARRIVGWKVSQTAQTDFVLDALEQALHARRPTDGSLIHRSDRGTQYVSIRYTERLADAGIEPSVGSVGDSYEREACPWGTTRLPTLLSTLRTSGARVGLTNLCSRCQCVSAARRCREGVVRELRGVFGQVVGCVVRCGGQIVAPFDLEVSQRRGVATLGVLAIGGFEVAVHGRHGAILSASPRSTDTPH